MTTPRKAPATSEGILTAPAATVVLNIGSATVDAQITEILKLLRQILKKEALVALDLSTITADIQSNSDAVDSAVELLTTLASEIAANANDPAAISALAAQLEAKTQALADAVVANTPAAP